MIQLLLRASIAEIFRLLQREGALAPCQLLSPCNYTTNWVKFQYGARTSSCLLVFRTSAESSRNLAHMTQQRAEEVIVLGFCLGNSRCLLTSEKKNVRFLRLFVWHVMLLSTFLTTWTMVSLCDKSGRFSHRTPSCMLQAAFLSTDWSAGMIDTRTWQRLSF